MMRWAVVLLLGLVEACGGGSSNPSDGGTSTDGGAGRFTIEGETVRDSSTGLVWQRGVAPGTYTWENAKTYCAGLALAGGGWHLPTIQELRTIIDSSRSSCPFINVTAFPGTPCEFFWSSSPFDGDVLLAWGVFFSSDRSASSDLSYRSYGHWVRCVR
jgi:hypothetical protein